MLIWKPKLKLVIAFMTPVAQIYYLSQPKQILYVNAWKTLRPGHVYRLRSAYGEERKHASFVCVCLHHRRYRSTHKEKEKIKVTFVR